MLEVMRIYVLLIFFFFNDTATTEIYTLSLHDALPIFARDVHRQGYGTEVLTKLLDVVWSQLPLSTVRAHIEEDRKSTRLNSSHANISYAVFCLKKKKKK